MAKSPKTSDDFKAVLEEIKTQSDRGAGIVSAALAEDALRAAIERRLVAMSNTRLDNLFGRFGPLATFSTKIELGMALGIYDDSLRKVLNMIRDVRNDFAHQMDATTFDYPEIAKSVLNARTPNVPKEMTVRQTFDTLFMTAILLLHAVASTEGVRVKLIGDTHPEIFVNLALAVHALQQQQASASKEPSGPAERAQPQQKPPPKRQ